MQRKKEQLEFGDFQTPESLTSRMLIILKQLNISPHIIIEPTCGMGGILKLSTSLFSPKKALGIEINKDYTDALKKELKNTNIEIINADIFDYIDVIKTKIETHSSVLFIGNPPWVTSSKSGQLGMSNLPQKANLNNLLGISAITGKSNFDISENILRRLIDSFHHMQSTFAFLCKTIVARNILKWIWESNIGYKTAMLYSIDSKKYFGVCCDSSFFILDFSKKLKQKTCKVYNNIEEQKEINTYGYIKNCVSGNIAYLQSQNYFGKSNYIWRCGVKHDCAKVFELVKRDEKIYNGFEEAVDIEPNLVYPLLKSSDLAKDELEIRKYIIVPQKKIGEDTSYIQTLYPKTWQYLTKYKDKLEKRKSIVYKNKPSFSIFSIGEYSFKPYKIAISALYKRLNFRLISQAKEAPIMLDDTCNFISFDDIEEATMVYKILTSKKALDFLNALIFWQSKRPITCEILNAIDLQKIATEIGLAKEYKYYHHKTHKIFQLELL